LLPATGWTAEGAYWAQRLRDEPDTIGLSYTWKNAGEAEVRITCRIIKTTFKGRGN